MIKLKKLLDKLLNVDKKTLLFLFIISIIGIVTGALYMTVLKSQDKELVLNSLNEFMNSIKNFTLSTDLFKNNLIINLLYTLIIWILGISIIGLPIVVFIIFFKSFLVSFSLSSFIIKYKFKGIIYGIIYVFPHSIFNLIIYIYLGIYSIKLSSIIINSIIYKKNINFKNIINYYFKLLLIAIIIIILSTIYETFVMPLCFKKIVNML